MTDIIVALIALVGTAIGTYGGILTSSKLTNYRIMQLEAKVEKHNGFAEKIPLVQAELRDHKERIEHLEKYHEEKI